MRKLFTILAIVLLTASVYAQAPQKMSYQAVIRDATNHLVITQVGMQISILQGSEIGTAVYVETHTTTPNINGLVTIIIGEGTKVSTGAFSDIDWSAGPYYIETATAVEAPLTSYTIFGTSQILSVPYSLSAKKAEGISGTITASQVSDFQTSVTNNSNVLANTAKNSYPTADATKLAGIAAGAEVNVNADWNATSGDAQVLNKPTTVAGYGITDAVTTTGDQTITGNKTFSGVTKVITPVNAADAATKAYVDMLQDKLDALEEVLSDAGIIGVIDIDANNYNLVTIGTQVWTKENLKTTKYNDGTPIDYPGTDNLAWGNNTSGAYSWYNNDEATYKDTYGALYNWYAVNTGKLCPLGWHVPTDDDFFTLRSYLTDNGYSCDGIIGGNKIAKSLASTSNWKTTPTGQTPGSIDMGAYRNKSGFTALPGGYRSTTTTLNLESQGHFWSKTTANTSNAWHISILYDMTNIMRNSDDKNYGYSVRCLKDN